MCFKKGFKVEGENQWGKLASRACLHMGESGYRAFLIPSKFYCLMLIDLTSAEALRLTLIHVYFSIYSVPSLLAGLPVCFQFNCEQHDIVIIICFFFFLKKL